MKTVILAGGRGTRIMEEYVPKPLVEIKGKPIIHHVMDIYARHGYDEFIVAAGYRHWMLSSYFTFASHGYDVEVVDTGLDSSTAERISRVLPDSTFFLTYGDGVSDIDISALRNFHQGCNTTATVTAVTPKGRFGVIDVDGDVCYSFDEKPKGLVSGGFFVLEPEVSEYLCELPFEVGALPRLAADGELSAYKHDGFWHPMDTLRDKMELEEANW